MRPMFPQCMSNGMCTSQCSGPMYQPMMPSNEQCSPHNNFHYQPYLRSMPSYYASPDLKLFELNKRLSQRTEECDNIWWEVFANEFFEDDACLTVSVHLDDGQRSYSISRILIPRYFLIMFESGVTDLSFQFRNGKESSHNKFITVDYECTMVTTHQEKFMNDLNTYQRNTDSPRTKDQMQLNENSYFVVFTEGRLLLEFSYEMKIKIWHFLIRDHQEFVPRNLIAYSNQKDPSLVANLTKNATNKGFTHETIKYLKMFVILEAMQELMSRHKSFQMSPKDCLKTMLLHKWQRIIPQENQKPNKRIRKRKPSVTCSSGAGKRNKNNVMSPGPINIALASQDVMIVGEPSLMGGEFGEEDERMITRLENTQFDPNTSVVQTNLDEIDDFSSINGTIKTENILPLKSSIGNSAISGSEQWTNLDSTGVDILENKEPFN